MRETKQVKEWESDDVDFFRFVLSRKSEAVMSQPGKNTSTRSSVVEEEHAENARRMTVSVETVFTFSHNNSILLWPKNIYYGHCRRNKATTLVAILMKVYGIPDLDGGLFDHLNSIWYAFYQS